MNTATAEKVEVSDIQFQEPDSRGEVAVFQPPRLPYHDAIKDRFGIDRAGWKALVEAIFPTAQTADSIIMALSYCRARKLDPFKRPVHIVPMWDSKRGGYIETVWPGIAELRTTAFRTGQYAGCDEADFGPMQERPFTGRIKVKGSWEDKTVTVSFPEWCRITVYRDLNGRVCKFVGPKVKWVESYATRGNSDIPNDMWESRPEGQIEKCAEAAALRKAFPEELGNQLTAEEMEGRKIAEARDVTPREDPPAPPPPPMAKDAPSVAPSAPADVPEPPKVTATPTPETAVSDAPNPGTDPEEFVQFVLGCFVEAKDGDALIAAWDTHVEPVKGVLFPPDEEDLMSAFRKREHELS